MHWPLELEVMGAIPTAGEEKFWCPNMFSLVSFAGITLDKSACRPSDRDVNWRPHMQGESPPVQGIHVNLS